MKKLAFGLIATVFMGLLSVNAQTITIPSGFFKLDRLGFGKVSSYAGPCVDAAGACVGSILDNTTLFSAGIKRTSESQVTIAFNQEIYQSNLSYLRDGLYVGTEFSLPRSVSERLGVDGEFVVARGIYSVFQKDGFYFITLERR